MGQNASRPPRERYTTANAEGGSGPPAPATTGAGKRGGVKAAATPATCPAPRGGQVGYSSAAAGGGAWQGRHAGDGGSGSATGVPAPQSIARLLESCDGGCVPGGEWVPTPADLAAIDRVVSRIPRERVVAYCRAKLTALAPPRPPHPLACPHATAVFIRDAAAQVAYHMRAQRALIYLPVEGDASLLFTFLPHGGISPAAADGAADACWEAGCPGCADMLQVHIPATDGVAGEVLRCAGVVNIMFGGAVRGGGAVEVLRGEDDGMASSWSCRHNGTEDEEVPDADASLLEGSRANERTEKTTEQPLTAAAAAAAEDADADATKRRPSAQSAADATTDAATDAIDDRSVDSPTAARGAVDDLYDASADAPAGFTAHAVLAAPFHIPASATRPAATGVVQVVNKVGPTPAAAGPHAFTAQDEALLRSLCLVLGSELAQEA